MYNLKIKFYQEAEACSWTNRFKTDMTFGQLRKAIYEGNLEESDIEAYSVDFDVHVPSKVFVIDGMNVSSIILEDGTMVRLMPKINGMVYSRDLLVMGPPENIWLDNLLEPLVKLIENNGTEEEKKKLIDDFNRKYRS